MPGRDSATPSGRIQQSSLVLIEYFLKLDARNKLFAKLAKHHFAKNVLKNEFEVGSYKVQLAKMMCHAKSNTLALGINLLLMVQPADTADIPSLLALWLLNYSYKIAAAITFATRDFLDCPHRLLVLLGDKV